MVKTIQVGQKGFTVTAVVRDQDGVIVPLPSGTAVEFTFKGSDDVAIQLPGVVASVAAGKAVYVAETADGIGEIAGAWSWQVTLDIPGGFSGPCDIQSFTALANL